MAASEPESISRRRALAAADRATIGRDETGWQRRTAIVKRFARRSPLGTTAIAVLIVMLLIAIVGPWTFTGDPEKIDALATFGGPNGKYLMGTDYLGRSVLARIAVGLRVSMALAAISALVAALVGALLGLIAGYFGGLVDDVIMRIADVFFGFPTLLLALLIEMITQPGVSSVILTILIATVPIFSRVARGPTLSVRSTEYVIAARVMGATSSRLIRKHILPNVLTPLLVQLTFTLSFALIAEGALSFLGLGVQPPRPSLGSLLRDGQTYMQIAPWMMLFPGLTLALAILAINLFGDELQTFTDPRLRNR
jgi:peptide/nickel transport system permease protein